MFTSSTRSNSMLNLQAYILQHLSKKYYMCSLKKWFPKKDLDGLERRVFETLLLKCPDCEKYSFNGSEIIKVSGYLKHLRNCEFSDYKCLTCNKNIHSKEKCYDHPKYADFQNHYAPIAQK